MHLAVEYHVQSVERLLQAGADPNIRKDGGWCALHTAAEFDTAAIGALLAHPNIELDPVSDDGRTPFDMCKPNTAAYRALQARGAVRRRL